MRKKVLFSFREVSHRIDDEAWDVRNFSWDLHLGERAVLYCQRPAQYEVLWRLMQRNLKPKHGVIEELRPVSTSSDQMISSRLNLSETMNRALESKLFEEHVWVEGKRMHVQSMMDQLQIPLSERHIPLQRVKPAILHRFQALLFMAARVQLLLARELPLQVDEITANALQGWHPYFPGTLIFFGKLPPQVGEFRTTLNVQLDGMVEIHF
ncbi:MAG: hypothetical protein HQM13_01615 [SAR324 cluster bacterium]|nr:hypothetical protein [SAR324 cluster bacterium]